MDVTKPSLPEIEDYIEAIRPIWKNGWLTNDGPILKDLEHKLTAYLELASPVLSFANGGLALQIAAKAMGVQGEIITTPFTYIATTSCLLWEGYDVKFVDIDPQNLTIDPAAIEAGITSQTEAIVATHVFGNPCDVIEIDRIAKNRGLAVLYDAAHAFGVQYQNQSILNYGDVSMVSLHATKLFHTVEGGLLTCKDDAVREKAEWMRRFGHKGHSDFHGVGINAKMSEFHAAMGLCTLKNIEACITQRLAYCALYDKSLAEFDHIEPAFHLREATQWNGSYYPIQTSSTEKTIALKAFLERNRIGTRRYFHPAINDVFGGQPTPIAHSISERILCLPLSPEYGQEEMETVIRFLQEWDQQQTS